MFLSFIKNFSQLLADFFIYIYRIKLNSKGRSKKIQIVAHRGWHNNENLIENTIQSFQTALDHNIYGIEVDVRWTKDLVPIIHHDETLERLWNNQSFIADINFSELQKIAPMIPTLEEVVTKFGKKLHLFIEIKNEGFDEIEMKKNILGQILNSLNPHDDFHFLTLEIDVVNQFNNFAPQLFLYVAEFDMSRMLRLTKRYNLGGVSGHYLLVDSEVIDNQKKFNKLVGTGFIRTKSSLNRERNRDVDFYFTNHPWNLI